jgi:hypothetical protein
MDLQRLIEHTNWYVANTSPMATDKIIYYNNILKALERLQEFERTCGCQPAGVRPIDVGYSTSL